MKKVLFLFTLLILFSISAIAQKSPSAYSFVKSYIGARELFKTALYYNGNEKLIIFMQKASVRAEDALSILDSLPKTILVKITAEEKEKLKTGLQTIVQKSTAIYFDDEQMLRLTLWISALDAVLEKTLPKLFR
ncbi:MAG TPA: hypothetical protein PKA77_07635 [Chitinophagaceae bacterium]|jgi:hypothetical protein|nr:hypothetical protein [Chitinophagaceae bacterium]